MAEAAEPSPRAQRHRELWESRSARLSQLLFATLLFGALATWKVARPAAALAEKHRTSSARLAESNGKLARLGEERGEIERVVAGLGAAQDAIAKKPWDVALEELKQGFVALRRAEECFRNDPKGTRDHFAAGANAGGGERSGSEARPVSDQGVPTNQVPPEAIAPAPLPLPSPEEEAAKARATRAVLLAPIAIDRDAAAAADARAFDKLWVDAASRAVKEHVTTKVATIVAQLHEQVEGPVAAALREAQRLDARAPKLRAATTELSQQLEQWRANHRDDGSWYATIQGKDDEYGGLRDLVRRWSDEIGPELATAQTRLAAELVTAQAQVVALEQEQSELRGQQEKLEASLQDLLPEWIRGFFTSAELVRFLPFALTLLGVAIAVGARLVRHHHRACRDELFPDPAARVDPAVSSCWTLVDRGAAGTLWSSLCFVAATAGWWLATDAALQCAAASWDDPFFGAPPCAAAWLLLPRAALFALPALAAVGIAAAWRDRR